MGAWSSTSSCAAQRARGATQHCTAPRRATACTWRQQLRVCVERAHAQQQRQHAQQHRQRQFSTSAMGWITMRKPPDTRNTCLPATRSAATSCGMPGEICRRWGGMRGDAGGCGGVTQGDTEPLAGSRRARCWLEGRTLVSRRSGEAHQPSLQQLHFCDPACLTAAPQLPTH